MASFQKYDTKQGKKWLFKIDIGIDPLTGRRRTTTRRGFESKKKAKDAADELEYQLKRGFSGKDDKLTVKEMADRWMKVYAASGNVKKKTVQTRVFTMKNIISAMGSIKIQNITYDMYQDFLIQMKEEKHFSATYIQSIHAIARMIFKLAKRRGIIYVDPTEDIVIPKYELTVEEIEEITQKYLETSELFEFLDAAKESRFKDAYDIFATLAYTGMRIGELIALNRKNIDRENRIIYVRETYSNVSTTLSTASFTPPKTMGSIRPITFECDVAEIFDRQDHFIKEAKLEFQNAFHDDGLMFPKLHFTHKGHAYYENFLNVSFKEILATTTIKKKLTPHSLRHTHVSLLAEAGVDLTSIMARLGHISGKTTTKIYMHVTKTMQRSAAQKFSDLLRKKLVTK